MIWMGLLSVLMVLCLWLGLRRYGRQGLLITAMIGALTVGGASYLYWGLGAYEMAESTEALNALSDRERAFVVAQAAQDEFLARNRVADQEIINLFQLAVELDPAQLTALGSLGIIAFEAGDYVEAVNQWTRMLGYLEPGSEQANAITLGITRARERLDARLAQKAELPAAAIDLNVALSTGLPESLAEATVFVFAREVGGSPRPVAARRFAAAELPATLSLTSEDALMGGRLYQGLTVEVMARMTLGDANGSVGDWFSEPVVMTLGVENPARLVISPPAL